MKKIIIVLSGFLVALAACNAPTEKENAQAELSKYKQEAKELEEKIKAIEANLPKNDSEHLISVKTLKIVPTVFEHSFSVGGKIEAENKAYISAELGGQIKKIYVEEGQRVNKGDMLIALNTSAQYAQLQDAKANLTLVATIFEKQKILWEQNIGSEIDFLQAKTNKESLENKIAALQAQIDMNQIKAPFDGIVDKINMKEGEMGAPGMELIRLVNLSKMEITADVAESYVASVKKGNEVIITFPAYPELSMKEKIYRTGNIINPANRTFEIALKINNPKELLKPNAMAVLQIKDYVNPEAIVVPSIVVKQDVTGHHFVFIAVKDNNNVIAQKQTVKIGKANDNLTEIIDGLNPNDEVIVEGYNLVSTGIKVAVE